jgi:hypothetical protein
MVKFILKGEIMSSLSLEPVLTGAAPPLQVQKVELPKAVQKRLLNERITHIALSILTLGLYALGVFVMDKLQAKWINRAFMPSVCNKPFAGPHPNRIQIPTYDNVKLDARELLCKNPTNKWMIYFCPNGALYEEVMYNVDPEELNANILYFNYRQCGHSEGTLKGATELLLDGSAAVEHLKRKGIENKDIELFGFSIGGAVAPTVAEHYPGIKYLGDRPPSSISAVVTAWTSSILGAIVKLTRFEINAIKAWKKIPEEDKALIYHRKDGVIKYPASLYKADKDWKKKIHPEWRVEKTNKKGKKAWGLADLHKSAHVKLVDSSPISGQAAHCRPYYYNEKTAIMQIAKKLLHAS